ncbi:AraC family transcriptional regulator [Variovorax sp. LjRoot290]|uniref:helix-turn-helix transcriptional regulator n=1 Tax=Variovorax sp. LjRoot290 TaxID=3342316 RepID=UPI003ECD56BC
MAYSRRIVFESALLSWQQLTLAAPDPAWSDSYRVDGPRLLLPLSACFECRIGAHGFVCDPASALWLSPSQRYRLRRPWADKRSALLIVGEDLGPSGRSPLPLAVHLQMAGWSQALAAQQLERLDIEEPLAAVVRALVPTTGEASMRRPHRAVERAREYIAAEPQRDDALTEIARAANCSAFHLARRFRLQTGLSLHGFRTRLRMTLALDRLRKGERNLSALAAELGYASHSHFTGVFRRNFGLTPSRMRTNLAAPALR